MNKYYKKVPPERRDKFAQFRQTHVPEKHTVNNLTWQYIISGDATKPGLLILPGALGSAESSWRTITLFEETGKYRLIIPNYPAEIGSMTGLADGIAEILALEGFKDIFVIGGSYGGMLAQVFTHRHPSLVNKLVLSHTYPPMPSRGRNVEPTLRLLKLLPLFIVKKMMRDRMTGILPPRPSPDLMLIAAQVRESIDTRLTRQAALNTYLRMADFDQQNFTAQDLASPLAGAPLAGWQGKTLILLAEDDPTTPESMRKALIDLYPGAKVQMFKGDDPATSILESRDTIEVIERFLFEE